MHPELPAVCFYARPPGYQLPIFTKALSEDVQPVHDPISRLVHHVLSSHVCRWVTLQPAQAGQARTTSAASPSSSSPSSSGQRGHARSHPIGPLRHVQHHAAGPLPSACIGPGTPAPAVCSVSSPPGQFIASPLSTPCSSRRPSGNAVSPLHSLPGTQQGSTSHTSWHGCHATAQGHFPGVQQQSAGQPWNDTSRQLQVWRLQAACHLHTMRFRKTPKVLAKRISKHHTISLYCTELLLPGLLRMMSPGSKAYQLLMQGLARSS